MQLSSLLDLGNGHSLRQLAEESRQENLTIRSLTEKSTQDGAAVKVLTMITLIYLPATVVSVSYPYIQKCAFHLPLVELLLDAICDSRARWKQQPCRFAFERMAVRRYMCTTNASHAHIMVGVGALSSTSSALN